MRWMRKPTNPSSCMTYVYKFIVKGGAFSKNRNPISISSIIQKVFVWVSWLKELKVNIMDIQDAHKMEWGPDLPHRPACQMSLEVQAGSSTHFASKDSLDGGNSSHSIIFWEHSCCITWWAVRSCEISQGSQKSECRKNLVQDAQQPFLVSKYAKKSIIVVGTILWGFSYDQGTCDHPKPENLRYLQGWNEDKTFLDPQDLGLELYSANQ